MQKLTCLTCHISLPTSESQREHYKGEWHIYNLKRKLTQQKPITENEFELIKQKHTQQFEQEPSEEVSFYCVTCSKNFYNEKAFNQHNSSKKHNQLLSSNKTNKNLKPKNETKNPEKKDPKVEVVSEEEFNESDWEEVDSEDEELEGMELEECLFCGEISEDMQMNLSHMSRFHSFFIPDVEYCVDVKGLLKYLGIKIAAGRCCLWCSEYGKQFASKRSAQQHMIDKGHSKIKFEHSGESLLEFEDFYDYTSSYPDGIDDEIDPNDFVLDNNDYELKLPSGAVIGHRSLFIYYKQNLKPESKIEKKSKNKELLNKVMLQYKALGWTGLTNKMAVKRAKDIHFMHRIQQKHQLRLGKQNNTVMQPHIRCQMGFK